MKPYLEEQFRTHVIHALRHLQAASIEALGTWLAANPPASDSTEDREAFFALLPVVLAEGGDAVTPSEG